MVEDLREPGVGVADNLIRVEKITGEKGRVPRRRVPSLDFIQDGGPSGLGHSGKSVNVLAVIKFPIFRSRPTKCASPGDLIPEINVTKHGVEGTKTLLDLPLFAFFSAEKVAVEAVDSLGGPELREGALSQEEGGPPQTLPAACGAQ